MPARLRVKPLKLIDPRNYRLYLSGILVEVLAVLLLMGIGFFISWILPWIGR
jgi:hypothetical protein